MANLMMPEADPEFKAYLKERAKKEAATDYHSLKEDFDVILHLASPVGPVGVLKHSGEMARYILDDI